VSEVDPEMLEVSDQPDQAVFQDQLDLQVIEELQESPAVWEAMVPEDSVEPEDDQDQEVPMDQPDQPDQQDSTDQKDQWEIQEIQECQEHQERKELPVKTVLMGNQVLTVAQEVLDLLDLPDHVVQLEIWDQVDHKVLWDSQDQLE